MAAIEQRTGKAPPAHEVSRDGRMACDWVPQYTEIIAAERLPTTWPRAIAVDSFDVRVRGFKEDGTPMSIWPRSTRGSASAGSAAASS
jgi:hypothetical protein